MGVYSEYLDKSFDFQGLTAERKKQLNRLSEIRGRDVLVYAADLMAGNAPTSLDYSDLLPITDQVSHLKGTALDLLLETPGGSGEAAEDIIRVLRDRYDDVAVIVPGWAKSAGTIMAMSADEILMHAASALGPIDAQISWQGKVFSADALIEGMEKIKGEVESTGKLNKAYIPILQGISPGELQGAENALNFAKKLVTDWLATYKFKSWTEHLSSGKPVTDADRQERAGTVAEQLCDHRRWLTHGRSIKMTDLRNMRLRITDYSENDELADTIRRYHTLLRMTFDTNIYKVIETPTSQIYRFMVPQSGTPAPNTSEQAPDANAAFLEVPCPKCKASARVQANLGKKGDLREGCVPFPPDNRFKCLSCGTEIDLSDARRQIEVQTKKKVVT